MDMTWIRLHLMFQSQCKIDEWAALKKYMNVLPKTFLLSLNHESWCFSSSGWL